MTQTANMIASNSVDTPETPNNPQEHSESRPAARWRLGILMGGSAVLVIAAGWLFVSNSLQAQQPLGKRWAAEEMVSMEDIDHSPYDALLQKYVDEDGYVDYASWKQSESDRRALQDYLTALSRATPSRNASQSARLAFWINVYNALTLEGILREYPTTSIRNHTSKLGGYNIWKHLPLLVGNTPFSLHEIEHEVLRPMGEPRIHFAIVCASIGCPRLLNEAYTAEDLESQLTKNSRDFFSRSQNLQVDQDSRVIYVSSILKWFGDDFGDSQQERFTYLKPYLPEEARELSVDPQTTVRYLDYDWNLNDQTSKPQRAESR